MKAALIISGYLRTFNENLPLLKKSIIDKFDEVDIYMHITKNEEKEDRYINHKNDIDFIDSCLNPVCLLFESNQHFSSDKNLNNLLNHWSKYYKLNEIKNKNEERRGKYDIVIKYRPDLNIISEDVFIGDLSDDVIYLPIDAKIDKNKLSNNYDNYVCDIFSYGNSIAMDKYFRIYENISSLINKYGQVSETILYNYLNDFNLSYKLLPIEYSVILSRCNIFAIAGDSGTGKTTLGNLLKQYFSDSFILECDRYHKWERNDEMWKNYTHLNPEANYLTKMSQDIFNLKIGNSIYQVDYDHSCGKFTESERIESCDNIIVCGLHSLYSDNDSVYDIKIFMDVEDDLRIKWKIERDMIKRGYSKDNIIKQIESRKEDYYKFIYPQRSISDIVINFFRNTNNESIGLKIFINNKHFIDNILKQLSNNGIFFEKKSNDSFEEITFHEYKECNILNGYSSKSYYDYILLFILSLKQKI